MAQLFSCFVIRKQSAANSSDDADSDTNKRHRSKPVSPRVGGKRGEDKLEGGRRHAGGGNHRKSNSLSSYEGAGGGRHSGREQPAVARAAIEEESFVAGEDWKNRGGGNNNNIKFKNNKTHQGNHNQGKTSPARWPDEEMDRFAAGSPRGGFEASSFSRNWEKSQASVSLSEWAIVCRPSADK